MLEGVVSQVVIGPDDASFGDRPSGDPLPDPEVRLEVGWRNRLVERGEIGQHIGAWLDLLDHRVLGVEETRGLAHRLVQDEMRIAQRGDLGRDLRQRTLALDASFELTGALTQLRLEVGHLGHVAHGAVSAQQPLAVADRRRADLDRQEAAVAARHHEADALLLAGIAHRAPRAQDAALRFPRHDRPEVAAAQLVSGPAGHALDRLGQVGEEALPLRRPDEVRRILDQEPIALLRLVEVAIEPRVAERDRSLVGESLEQPQVVIVERANGLVRDGEGPEHDAVGAA